MSQSASQASSKRSEGEKPSDYKEVERIQVGEVVVIFTEKQMPDGPRHSFGFFKEYSRGGQTTRSPYFTQKHVEALAQLGGQIDAVLKKLRAGAGGK